MTRVFREVTVAPGILADVCDDGSGEWLLLVHSRFANKSIWSDVAARIPRGSICAFNQRGFNPGDRAPAKPEYSAESLTAVFDALAPRRAVLVGTSIGAGVALAACTDARLPIVGAVLAGFLVPSAANAAVATRYQQGSLAQRTFTPSFIATNPTAVARFAELNQQVERAAREFSIDDFWKFLVRFPYHTIRVPVLFVTGADDTLMPPHIVRESLRRLPTARSVVIPDAGHGIISQAPEVFLRHLLEFLDSIEFPGGERTG